jgi:hypothetical protein
MFNNTRPVQATMEDLSEAQFSSIRLVLIRPLARREQRFNAAPYMASHK